ncbi:methyltransferase domain-containing protein [Devriesea agamarum]|uniref:methyltransferase domain-containing protein n=1 Tax=Devriesea agamarum TaxID=472569 RepID=UPI0009FBAA9E|nr:methyltransferase domain-containing protein [Devriesea agamarum]
MPSTSLSRNAVASPRTLCSHFDAHRCRSCTLLDIPYARQIHSAQQRVETMLAPVAPRLRWLPPVSSAVTGFRNKAKMVVGGSTNAPVLGLVDPEGRPVDLTDCPLYPPIIHAVLPLVASWLRRAQVPPYDVRLRRGDAKFALVTCSPNDQVMVRIVLRSPKPVPRLREHLPALLQAAPAIRVVSINIQPEHKAVLEGPQEIVLTEHSTLPMPLVSASAAAHTPATVQPSTAQSLAAAHTLAAAHSPVLVGTQVSAQTQPEHPTTAITLHLRPQSFFQTNTAVAAALYDQARTWINALQPATVWDLFCGVGGFAVHAVAPGRYVTGVELSDQAIDSARRSFAALRDAHAEMNASMQTTAGAHTSAELNSSAEMDVSADKTAESLHAQFIAADALAWARAQLTHPDLVIVNPPRRGLGELAHLLESSTARHVIYSSCNPESLARDLAAMPSWRAEEARLLDMFPHTTHGEVIVRLVRPAGS